MNNSPSVASMQQQCIADFRQFITELFERHQQALAKPREERDPIEQELVEWMFENEPIMLEHFRMIVELAEHEP